MAKPTTKQELIDHCLRKLGAPVLEINVSDEQLDDIVDDAKTRRGKPSIKQIWKNKISVLMGDYILSKALINMVSLKDFEA